MSIVPTEPDNERHEPDDSFPLGSEKNSAELIKRLRNWRFNNLLPWMMARARISTRSSDQKVHLSWVNKFIQGIIDLFPKRGRPPLPPGAAQTVAQRVQKHRQREKDWSWLKFPIIPHPGYLVIEASPEVPAPAFDARHGVRIMIGFELQEMMDTHHKEYPGQKHKPNREWQPGMDTEYHT